MPIEIIAVEPIDGRTVPRAKRPRDTLAIARLIMDESAPAHGHPTCPSDELALMVLLEGAIDGGQRGRDGENGYGKNGGMTIAAVLRVFGGPRTTLVDVVNRAEKAGRITRVPLSKKVVYLHLTTRGIRERQQRRGNR